MVCFSPERFVYSWAGVSSVRPSSEQTGTESYVFSSNDRKTRHTSVNYRKKPLGQLYKVRAYIVLYCTVL